MDTASPEIEKEVIALVAYETGMRAERIRPNTTIFGDTRIDGDDGVELLRHFGEKFGVDMTACRPIRHFLSEGLDPLGPFHALVFIWRALVEKDSTPESRARLIPIRVQDLIDSAKCKKWTIQYVDGAN